MNHERSQPPQDEGPIEPNRNDPYADEDLSTYPTWWREQIEHFREFDMRPYRPPRFSDGEYVPSAIEDLEEEFNVKIRFRSLSPEPGDDWELWVNSNPVMSVERYRDGNGYSVYLLNKEELREIIVDGGFID